MNAHHGRRGECGFVHRTQDGGMAMAVDKSGGKMQPVTIYHQWRGRVVRASPKTLSYLFDCASDDQHVGRFEAASRSTRPNGRAFDEDGLGFCKRSASIKRRMGQAMPLQLADLFFLPIILALRLFRLLLTF